MLCSWHNETFEKTSGLTSFNKGEYLAIHLTAFKTLLIASLMVVSILTGCSGEVSKGGVWVVTKAYLGDKVYYEKEYDNNGLVLKSTNYYNDDPSSISTIASYTYETSNADVFTIVFENYNEDGSEEGTTEQRYKSEIDGDGRILRDCLWTSSEGPLEESSLLEENALVTTCKYDENGNIREIVNEDSTGASGSFVYKSIGYDTYGYARIYRANKKSNDSDIVYELSYSDDGIPKTVAIGNSKYTFDTDTNGNIIAIYDDRGQLLRQFEYKYIESPKRWFSRHVSVYEGCTDW